MGPIGPDRWKEMPDWIHPTFFTPRGNFKMKKWRAWATMMPVMVLAVLSGVGGAGGDDNDGDDGGWSVDWLPSTPLHLGDLGFWGEKKLRALLGCHRDACL